MAPVRTGSAGVPNVFENRVVRPVRIFAEQLSFDGLLNISLGARTLDELNLGARSFLTLATPPLMAGSWTLKEGKHAINKASLLFVLTISDPAVSLTVTAAQTRKRHFDQ